MKRTRVLAPCQDTAQSNQRCRTLRTTLDTMISLDADRPSQKRTLTARPTTLATEERLKRSHARLFVWEKDMRRIQAQETLSDATTENETEAIPRSQRTLSDEASRRRRLLVCRMANDAAGNGMNLLQRGAVDPLTRLNYATSFLKFGSWLEHLEFMKGNPASSGERLLSVWMDKYPSFGRHGARKLPKTWRSFQGWQYVSPGRSRKLLVRAVWSGIACRLVEQGQHSMGRLVMTGLLSCARPGDPLRMRNRQTTFNDTPELDGPLARKLVSFGRPSETKDRKNLCGPSPIRFSAAFPESDDRLDVATNSTQPMETFWPVNRHHRRLLDVAASQKARTMASHENRPTIRETLLHGATLRILTRKTPTTSSAMRRTTRGLVARRPAHGSFGTWWPALKGHFVALVGSGTRQMCEELRKQGVTARMWSGTELTDPSAFRSLARERKNSQLRAAFVAPHVSEESVVLRVLERLRFVRGPLLVECGPVFSLLDQEIAEMRRRPVVDTHKFPSSHRRQPVGDVSVNSLFDTQRE